MIKTGTCGFSAAHDKYFATFPLIEVQKTFYQPPRVSTAERWRDEEAPQGFEFTLKAWQLITHEPSSPTYRRLSRDLSEEEKSLAGSFRLNELTREAWESTRRIARALEADKVIFQCPASFEPTTENKDRLRGFFGGIEREGLTCIWEPRGEWEPAEVCRLCEELDLVHCVDPWKGRVATEGLLYYRLHGIGGYRHAYSDEELEELLEKCGRRPSAYALFNNQSMFEDARRFQQMTG